MRPLHYELSKNKYRIVISRITTFVLLSIQKKNKPWLPHYSHPTLKKKIHHGLL